jgi:hypothetical protein
MNITKIFLRGFFVKKRASKGARNGWDMKKGEKGGKSRHIRFIL